MTDDANTKNALTLFAYVVEEYQSGKEIKSSWTRVGLVFLRDDGDGFTIRIKPGLAVSGRIVVRPLLSKQDDNGDAVTETDTGDIG
jgi:hypothetical protein